MRIGIDLGTTNSALAYIDPQEALEADFPPIRILDIPQHVAAGRVESLRTLPSFLYLGDQTYVGAYAREQGALVPTRSVHSAKSWLSNPDVDRNAKILPWDSQESARELSPVEVSASFLSRIREAWDAKFPAHPLAATPAVSRLRRRRVPHHVLVGPLAHAPPERFVAQAAAAVATDPE